MKHRIACLFLAVGMLLTGAAFAAGTDAPPPHAPPPVTEASAGSPAGIHTLSTRQLQSGDTYKASMTAMKKATQSDNVLIFDITATDAAGQDLHQLTETTEVTIPLPQTYVIQPGNTALVYYLPGDGTAVPCPTELHEEDPANRHVVFRTDHFSLYAVAEVAKAPDAPAPAPGASDTLTYPTGPVTVGPDTPPEAQASSAPTISEPSDLVEPPVGKPPVSNPEAPTAPIPTIGATRGFPVAAILIPAAAVLAGVVIVLKKKSK